MSVALSPLPARFSPTQPASPTDPALNSSEVRKLKKAAADFEAMLLANWWSSMKESGLGNSDEESDPGHETLDELGIQAMSGAVASGGGLGIGAMLVKVLLSNAERVTSPEATAGNTRR